MLNWNDILRPSQAETPQKRFESLLMRLAYVMASSQEPTDDEIGILENMDEVGEELTSDSVEQFRTVSADLFMLRNHEVYEARTARLLSDSIVAGELLETWRTKPTNWPLILTLLRQPLQDMPDFARAYLRGRAYDEVGLKFASAVFYDFAATRAENKTAYRYMALQVLSEADLKAAFSVEPLLPPFSSPRSFPDVPSSRPPRRKRRY